MTDMTVERDRIADLLELSAGLLENEGWLQGEYDMYIVWENKTSYCAVGAIRHVAANSTELEEAKRWLCRVLGFEPETVSTEDMITTWNDRVGRTKQEVLDAFHKATKLVLGVAS